MWHSTYGHFQCPVNLSGIVLTISFKKQVNRDGGLIFFICEKNQKNNTFLYIESQFRSSRLMTIFK